MVEVSCLEAAFELASEDHARGDLKGKERRLRSVLTGLSQDPPPEQPSDTFRCAADVIAHGCAHGIHQGT